MFIYFDLTQNYKIKKNFKNMIIFFMSLTVIFISFIRIYHGYHSFSQSILGCLFGCECFLFVRHIKDELRKYLIMPIFYKNRHRDKNPFAVLSFMIITLNYFLFIMWAYVFTEFE